MSPEPTAARGSAGSGPAPFSRRARVRYKFDEYMSRGTVALVLALFAATMLVVLVATVVIWGAGWVGQEVGPVGVFWRAMLATFDPAVVGNEEGSPGFLISLLLVTLAGIFVTSILIGILTTGIEGRLDELRKGRSMVVAEGHAVILGWSQQIFTVIEELLASGQLGGKPQVVVLADRDKVEMQDEIAARVTSAQRGQVVCRTGSTLEAADLRLVSIDTARSINLLSAVTPHADAGTIKTILAIVNNPARRQTAYHIVAEIRRPANLPAAKIAGGAEAQLIVVDELVARIVAQTCRQSGLSAVYEELLNFEGDELYLTPVPASLVGGTYGDALTRFATATPIGVRTADVVALNPPMDRRLDAADRLIVIAADEASVRSSDVPLGVIDEATIASATSSPRAPERTLILDWNRRAPAIVRELDHYVAPGSHVLVATPHEVAPAALDSVRKGLRNATVDIEVADPGEREQLEAICAQGFDHVIVLSLDDQDDPQLADARTLITLLHLREIDAQHRYDFSITSEMVDLRNRALAQVTRADDFIVSDRIASLLMSQLAQQPELKEVFDDLFDPDSSEIYLRPAAGYVLADQDTTFATVVEAARRRRETAIGYRDNAAADDAARDFGIVLNPSRAARLRLGVDDHVIVLAEEG